jgi:hypothetical protein
MRVFFVFLVYLWPNLWWFLTSGPLVIEPMLDYFIDGYEEWANQFISRHKRRQIAYGFSLFGIVFASFLAFKDVYFELQATKRQLDEAQRMPAKQGTQEHTKALARLQTDNARLTAELRSTRSQLSALQESLKPHHFSDDQRQKFTAVLASHDGRQFGTISVSAFPSCHRCLAYAHEIANAITSIPGWGARARGNHLLRVDFVGLGLGVQDPQSLPPGARVLADALKAAELQFTIETLDFLAPDGFMLIMGNKP